MRGLISSVTRSPLTRGSTVKPVDASRITVDSVTTGPCGVGVTVRARIGTD